MTTAYLTTAIDLLLGMIGLVLIVLGAIHTMMNLTAIGRNRYPWQQITVQLAAGWIIGLGGPYLIQHAFGKTSSGPSSSPTPRPTTTRAPYTDPGPSIDGHAVLMGFGWTALVMAGIAALIGLILLSRRLLGRRRDARALRASRVEALHALTDRYDRLVTEWRRYTADDIDLILDNPALSDLGVPEVAAHQEALQEAMDRRIDPKDFDDSVDPLDTDFYKAVGRLETTWRAARAASTRIAESRMSEEERRLLATARGLWPMVGDAGATPAERAAAAGRLEQIMRQLALIDDDRTPAVVGALERARTADLAIDA